jgi:hypothetical protein
MTNEQSRLPAGERSLSPVSPSAPSNGGPSPNTVDFYRRMVRVLVEAGVPFLVGGAYALARYTGIERHTRDLDFFAKPEDSPRVLALLASVGCDAEFTFPHWLGKAYCDDDYIDVIYSSGNGIARVDDDWFANSVEEIVLGEAVRLVPPEEMLWSKAFVQERERFDGADINHLLLHMADALDWQRLLRRFDGDEPVLLAHIILFRYSYPSEAHRIPLWVIERLQERSAEPPPELAAARVCRGTLLSRKQYLIDIGQWDFRDSRLPPFGSMSEPEIARWTAAIDESA